MFVCDDVSDVMTDTLIRNNGQWEGDGEFGSLLAQNIRFDFEAKRPFVKLLNGRPTMCYNKRVGKEYDEKAQRYVPKYEVRPLPPDQQRTDNALMLRKEEWVEYDRIPLMVARQELRAWADLAASNTYGGFDGWGSSVLEWETMTDPGFAMVDMNGLSEGSNTSPQWQLEGVPLPITHSDFFIDKRELAISRKNGMPLSTTKAELATRRVLETIEKTTIGTVTGITGTASTLGYGTTSAVYGYINYPNRLTKTDLTIPTGTNATTTLSEVLAMRSQLMNNNYKGPYIVYHSTDWDQYMDGDYIASGGNNPNQTLRQRLLAVEGINAVRRLDYLTPAASHAFTLIMVQMTSNVARAVIGMSPTVMQWEEKGGLLLKFKVACIMVPNLRNDAANQCGILHARTA